MFDKKTLIKKFNYDYSQNDMSYIIKTFMVIIQHYKKITIYITKAEDKTELQKELDYLT